MRRFLVLVAAAGLCAGQSDSYRASVRLVNIGFSVRDARGALVTDLTRDDVEIRDDGAVQPIDFFVRSEDLPLSLGLVVDASGSQQPFVKRHEKDLKEFLKRVVREGDQAFLVRFGNHVRLGADVGAPVHAVLEALDGKRDAPELGPPEIRILGTAFYDALYLAVTEKLDRAAGARRALVVFSDGEDNSSSHHMLDAIEAAQASNAIVYGIRYTEVRHGRWNARNKYGKSVMARISHDTGGVDFDSEETDLKTAFRAIDEDLRSMYEVAYRAPAADGTFHKITIRLKRPGLTVRTKAGYYARD